MSARNRWWPHRRRCPEAPENRGRRSRVEHAVVGLTSSAEVFVAAPGDLDLRRDRPRSISRQGYSASASRAASTRLLANSRASSGLILSREGVSSSIPIRSKPVTATRTVPRSPVIVRLPFIKGGYPTGRSPKRRSSRTALGGCRRAPTKSALPQCTSGQTPLGARGPQTPRREQSNQDRPPLIGFAGRVYAGMGGAPPAGALGSQRAFRGVMSGRCQVPRWRLPQLPASRSCSNPPESARVATRIAGSEK
jgi:hypothetical protein